MRVLADTSIWVDHLRKTDAWFGALLAQRGVVVHPFVIGELALGNMAKNLIRDLCDLPQAVVANVDEVLELIQQNDLSGSGIGYVDTHLLASVMRMPETQLLTNDRRLHAAAARLAVAFDRQA